jgi:hypothetical protein
MKPEVVATAAVLLTLLIFVPAAKAQAVDSSFGSKNTYSAFLEYANDSSHIVLGRASNRKLAALGVQYERRLLSTHALGWRFAAEFRPLILESDPTETVTETQTSPPPVQIFVVPLGASLKCTPGQGSFSFLNPATGVLLAGTDAITCGRRWTFAQGLSPVGTRINLLPHRRLQPTASLLAGYMLSAKKIPLESAGSFNFTFEFGAGLEYFQTQSRSVRLEYNVQHFSNAYTAQTNYGVDTGLFKLTYNFGR